MLTQTRYVYNTFIEEMHASAETLLYYFHYNNKGGHPFAKNWTSRENVVMAELDEEQASFLAETVREVMRRSKDSHGNSHSYVARTDRVL